MKSFKNILTRLTTVLTNIIRQIGHFYRELCCATVKTADTTKMALLSGKCNYFVNNIFIINKICTQYAYFYTFL